MQEFKIISIPKNRLISLALERTYWKLKAERNIGQEVKDITLANVTVSRYDTDVYINKRLEERFMTRKKKKTDSDDPKPLNFDRDEEKGPSDHLKEPFMTPEEERGDNEDDQYYDEEESLSPEETKIRKEENDL